MNKNQENFINILKTEKVFILLAPAFAIDYKHKSLISMLKKLGADKITELTFGAKMVNINYAEYIKSHPDQKYFIASPCPIIVSTIKTQYKELLPYLMPFVSPLMSQAKITQKLFPDHKLIFISPCKAKQMIEAKEYPELISEVITFKELQEIFDSQNIKQEDFKNSEEIFDSIIESSTKIYPISGGLMKSAHLKDLINEDEICISDGIMNVRKIFEEIKSGKTKYRFFDLLSCDGGCIGGGELNKSNLDKYTKQDCVLKYKQEMENEIKKDGKDHSEDVKNIDFTRKF